MLSSCSKDEDYIRQLNFIGDSMIANWDVETSFPNIICENHGVDGSKIPYLSSFNNLNKDVVVLMGTNNLSGNTTGEQIEQLVTDYITHVCQITNKRLIIISVLPTSDVQKNKAITLFNSRLKALHATIPNAEFVDCYSAFLGSNGQIKPDLTREGLHLNDYGYILLTSIVKSYL